MAGTDGGGVGVCLASAGGVDLGTTLPLGVGAGSAVIDPKDLMSMCCEIAGTLAGEDDKVAFESLIDPKFSPEAPVKIDGRGGDG